MDEIKPTEEQQAVIEGKADIKRVIACAGSGKTWVITRGIISVLRQSLCRPSEILALTFTRNAADNMRVRIRENIQDISPDRIDIYTFNSFGNQIVKENSLQLSVGKDFRVLSSAETWQIIYDIFKNYKFRYLDIGKTPGKTVQEILSYIDTLKNNLITPPDLENYVENYLEYLGDYKSAALLREEKQAVSLQGELCFIYRQYEELKKEGNCIDYQDQVYLPYNLLKSNVSVRDKYTERYRYIFVDEFQDTNMAQAYLLALLNNRKVNIMVVGDDDQGIYAFRGACVENILNFHRWEAFRGSRVSDFYLTTNFRSGKSIIGVINNIISANENRFDKMLKPAPKSPLSEAVFFYCPTHEQEAERIAGTIKELREQGMRLKNIAILCRRKKFDAVTRYLDLSGLKYEIVGSKSFYFEKEILFIISWLYVIYDLYDEIYLFYLLKSDRYRICDRDLFFVKRDFKNGKPVRLIGGIEKSIHNPHISKEAKDRLSSFLNELKYYIRKSYSLRLRELVSLIYEHSGLRDELKSSFNVGCKKKIKNIEALIKITNDFEDNFRESSLESFNTYLREVAKTDFEGPESLELSGEDSVKVMSIHAAKGLEFDAVFLPMLWRNDYLGRGDSQKYSMPAELRKDNEVWARKKEYTSQKAFKEELKKMKTEEERRIFYVACSRAKRLLVLSHSDYRNHYDQAQGKSEKKIVPFIMDALASKDLKVLDNESLRCIESMGFNGEDKQAARDDFYKFLGGGKKINIPDIDWEKANENLLRDSARVKPAAQKTDIPARDSLKRSQRVFSLTSLLTYVRCPVLYECKYIHNIPEKYSQSLKKGEEVHSLIEKITRLKVMYKDLGKDRLLAAIKQKNLKPYAEGYMQSVFFNLSGTEKIWLEQLIYHKLNDFIITSKIDRLEYLGSAKYRIIDYKVSKKPLKENPTHINQLKAYAMACSDVYGCSIFRIKACLFYMEDLSVSEYHFKPEAVADFKDILLSAIECINAGRFNRHRGKSCSYCGYRDFCMP
ncbi:MAG: ATP-dependent helicase [Actinomycetota bacterium]